MSDDKSSRISGFYRLPIGERRELIAKCAGLPASALSPLDSGGIDLETADGMIENVVGTYALPLGIALNFRVNDEDGLVPMVVEEPSVIAAASNAARLARAGGGFQAEADPPVMIAQVQLTDVADPDGAARRIEAACDLILAAARDATPRLVARGGGPVGLQVRILARPGSPDGGIVVVHIDVDCRDAMGANLVNSVAELVADRLAQLAGPGTQVGLRILSNLADHRCVRVRTRIPAAALACDSQQGGGAVRDAIVAASRFAELDPYRAATHNKGIMNGVDAVLLATGNDWRGVESGAHAYAARTGRYLPLAVWRAEGDDLVGELVMPMAVGTIGGAVRVHAGARLALALAGIKSAQHLACVAGAAGLAANLAALRALATEGIQRGHMSLHARVVARAAGATGELHVTSWRGCAGRAKTRPIPTHRSCWRFRSDPPSCRLLRFPSREGSADPAADGGPPRDRRLLRVL
jgi:hydroxymethylglutaryl-CoA reductase